MKISLRVQHLPVPLLQSPMGRAGPTCFTCVNPWQTPFHTDGIGAVQVDFGGQHTLLVVTGDNASTSTAPAAAMTTAGGIFPMFCALTDLQVAQVCHPQYVQLT